MTYIKHFMPFIFGACCLSISHAQSSSISEELEQFEKSWNKFQVFKFATSILEPSGRTAAMYWLQKRILSKSNIDSRYAITYSSMLWKTGQNNLKGEAVTFAIVGYNSLRLESALCNDQDEARKLATIWLDAIKPQLSFYASQPLSGAFRHQVYALTQQIKSEWSLPPTDINGIGPYWQCYLLPSYTQKIINEPETRTEQIPEGEFRATFIYHPSISPEFSSKETFMQRKNKIELEVKNFVGAF